MTQENLRLANECLELHQDGKENCILKQEIETLKEHMHSVEQRNQYLSGQFNVLRGGYEDS